MAEKDRQKFVERKYYTTAEGRVAGKGGRVGVAGVFHAVAEASSDAVSDVGR